MMILRKAALLLVVLALVGCNNEKNRNLIDSRIDQSLAVGEEAVNPAPKVDFDPLTVSDSLWSGNKSVRLNHGMPLPSKYEASKGVTIISGTPLSMQEIIAAITSQTGIPVNVGAGATMEDFGEGGISGHMIPLAYEGPLSNLLNILGSNYGVSWKYDGSTIKIFRHETRVFVVEALPGSQSISDSMGSVEDSGADSSGGSSPLDQTTQMSMELKVWDELNQTLSSILAGDGMVVLAPSSGTATVTTTPERMEIVAKFMEEENERLSKQVAINVEVYTVTLSDADSYDVSVSTALQKVGNMLAGDVTAASSGLLEAQSVGMGSLSFAIFDLKRNSSGTVTGEVSALFQALSKLGDVTRVTQFPMVTLNNKTVSRRVGKDTAYVESITQEESTSDNVGSSSVEASVVSDGFSMQITPRILSDGRVLMQYSFSMVDLIQFNSLDTGTISDAVQLPEMASRAFAQQALLKSGSTLVIGGHDDERTEQNSQGVGSPFNYLLGGGSYNSKERTLMFIAITPQVIDVNRKEGRN